MNEAQHMSVNKSQAGKDMLKFRRLLVTNSKCVETSNQVNETL